MVAFCLSRHWLQKIVQTTRISLQAMPPAHTSPSKRGMAIEFSRTRWTTEVRRHGPVTHIAATFVTFKPTMWVTAGPIQSFLGNLVSHPYPKCMYPYLYNYTSPSGRWVWGCRHCSSQGPTLCLKRSRYLVFWLHAALMG